MAGIANFIADRIAMNRQRSFSRFIIRLSVAATIISVAVMILTVSLANGFQNAITDKIFNFWGHIRIQEKQPGKTIIAEEWPIDKNDTVEKLVLQQTNVKSIAPFATRYALLKSKEGMEGLMVKGLDKNYDFNRLAPFLKKGNSINFPDSSFSRQIWVSTYTADRMQLNVGDSLLLYFIHPNEQPRPKKISIAGLYKTGIEEYDHLFAIADIRLIQQLNNWNPNQIGGYEVFLKDPANIDDNASSLFNEDQFPGNLDAVSIKQVMPQIFDWLQMLDLNRYVLLGFMIIVALINLITALLILVLERVRMIGVLKSLGATDWTVQKIFLHQSLIIMGIGISIGTALAVSILWIQEKTGFIKLNEDAYFLDKAAVKIVGWQVLAIDLGTLAICLLVLLIPSWLVRKIQPAKAIQFR